MRKLTAGLALVLASGCSNSNPAPTFPDPTTTAPVTTQLIQATEPTTTMTEPPTTTTEVVRVEPAAIEPNTSSSLLVQTTTAVGLEEAVPASGRCGGSLPPCYVMARESRGSLTVYNYEGSGASGKWQIMPRTWDGYGGYDNAADAPESVQDAKARLLWDGGRGCWHWDAC